MKHCTERVLRISATLCLAFIATLYFAPGVHAQGRMAASLLPPEAAAQLAAAGKASRSGSGVPAFLPDHPASAAIRSAIAAENPSLLVEAVFTLPRPRPANAAARATELASIYGILRSLGSLQGIEYYSASRKTMRTLYAESYIVDGPETKVRLSDPVFPAPGSIPASETVYAVQRDLSFGENTYRYEYDTFSDGVLLKSTNITRMSYGVLPALSSGALATRLFVIQADDAIIFYAESGANAPGILKGRLEESFANRADALFKWFAAKAAGQGMKP
jgi:hypothetical protein